MALTMLHRTLRRGGAARPGRLEALLSAPRAADRAISDVARYDRFEYIRLKRWSAGRVAVIGDAAHAIPPNIGQGAGCAMMNALSLAVYLDAKMKCGGLATWEEKERPLTDHTQRISLFLGMPTIWPPPLAPRPDACGKVEMDGAQRTKTALHMPTGT